MSTRRERKEALRQERLERQRQADEAARRKRLAGYGAGGVLAVAIVVAIVIAVTGGGGSDTSASGDSAGGPKVSYPANPPSIPPAREFDLKKAAAEAGCKLEDPPNEGNTHVAGSVTYKHNPPTSGNHNPTPAEDGVYEQAPAVEHTVHSLEHGRIEIQFKPSAPASVIGRLKALYDEDTYHMLLFPNQTNMPYEVAATTWDHALECPRMNDKVFDAIRAFKERYRDKGPEFVP